MFCFISISALDLEISIWRHVSSKALSTFPQTYCSAETAGWVFRISHHVTYWQYELAELLGYVITEKPYWKQLVLLRKWIPLFVSHSSANCWYYLSNFKYYLANRVLPNASGNGVLFDRIYRVISSVDIIYRYQNHALRETEISISRFANCSYLYYPVSLTKRLSKQMDKKPNAGNWYPRFQHRSELGQLPLKILG